MVLVLASALTAHAAAPTLADKKAAKEHYDRGTTHYNLGEFVEAAEEYKAAYRIIPENVILYNIGQIYRLAKEYDQALFFYNSYLSNLTDANARKEVEARIAKIQTLIKEKKEKNGTEPKAGDPTAKADPGKPDAVAKPGDRPTVKADPTPTGNSDRVKLLVEVIKQKRQGFRDCFDLWSKTHAGIEGQFVLVLWLQPDGKLDEVEAAGNGLQAPEVERCLIDHARTLTYPASPSGRMTKFTYPFNFKPLPQ